MEVTRGGIARGTLCNFPGVISGHPKAECAHGCCGTVALPNGATSPLNLHAAAFSRGCASEFAAAHVPQISAGHSRCGARTLSPLRTSMWFSFASSTFVTHVALTRKRDPSAHLALGMQEHSLSTHIRACLLLKVGTRKARLKVQAVQRKKLVRAIRACTRLSSQWHHGEQSVWLLPCNYCCWLCITCVRSETNQASLALSQRFDSSPWAVWEDVVELDLCVPTSMGG